MPKSIKLNDDTYIDASGIWDSGIGEYQTYLNRQAGTICQFANDSASTVIVEISKNADKGFVLIFGNANGLSCISLCLGNSILNLGSAQLACSHSETSTKHIYTISGLMVYGTYSAIASNVIVNLNTQ